jgi:hypothetical protein
MTPSLLSLLVLAACTEKPSDTASEVSPSMRLHAEGTRIVDTRGDEVRFRGVALGGWIFHENWITAVDYPATGRLHVLGEGRGHGDEVDAALQVVGPNEKGDAEWLAAFASDLATRIPQGEVDALLADLSLYPPIVDDADLALRRVLEARFGIDGRDAILDAFEGAWITREDIAWIAAQGFNTVRIPMGWRGLTSQTDLAPPTRLTWNEAAFSRLDTLLSWCAEAGIWAVLDIQEAPGGQNEYNGEPSTLYADPAMQALTVSLWEELSRRYQDHDEVAAYSLLAEPMSAPSVDARDALYDLIAQALRARGDDHLLVLHDGFMGMPTMPDPATYGWDGVVYSTHLFEWGADSESDYEALAAMYAAVFADAQEEQGVPYYIGSFSTFVDADWAIAGAADLVAMFEDNGWGWTVWTYKRIDDPIDAALYGTSTSWGVRGRLVGDLDRPDLHLDDEPTLLSKMAAYAALVVDPNTDLLDALATRVP